MLKDAICVSALYPCDNSEISSNLAIPTLFVDDMEVSLPDREVEVSEKYLPHNHSHRGREETLFVSVDIDVVVSTRVS